MQHMLEYYFSASTAWIVRWQMRNCTLCCHPNFLPGMQHMARAKESQVQITTPEEHRGDLGIGYGFGTARLSSKGKG